MKKKNLIVCMSMGVSLFITSQAFAFSTIWLDHDGDGTADQLQVHQADAQGPITAFQEVNASGDVFLGAQFTESYILNFLSWEMPKGTTLTGEYTTVAGSSPALKELWAEVNITGEVDQIIDATTGEYTVAFNGTNVEVNYTAIDSSITNTLGNFDVISGGGDSLRFNDNSTPTLDFGAELLASSLLADTWYADNSGTQGVDLSTAPDLFLFSLADSSLNFEGSSDINIGGIFDYYRELTFTDNGTTIQYDVVPEPGTMVLFGTGLIGLAGISRRKKQS